MSVRLVCIDDTTPRLPLNERGLYAVIDDEGGTLAVGYLEPTDSGPGLLPGSTVDLRFRVKGGIRE